MLNFLDTLVGFGEIYFFLSTKVFFNMLVHFFYLSMQENKMKNLILALNKANLTDSDIETVLTDFENWIDSRVVRSELKMRTESIVPIQKETEGIRSEIRILAETMKHGFAIMEERLQKMDQKSEERFLRMDQKLEFTRKNLEIQIASTRENLETQIKANDKQLSLVQKLLWLVLTLVLGLFAKAVHLFWFFLSLLLDSKKGGFHFVNFFSKSKFFSIS